MTKKILTCLALAALVTSPLTTVQAGLFGSDKKTEEKTPNAPIISDLNATTASFADLAAALIPTVVNISSTAKTSPFNEAEQDLKDIFPQFPEGSPFGDLFEKFMEHPFPAIPNNPRPTSSLGSGFIIDAKNGYIITNNHVVKDAEEVRVTLPNDETTEAEVIGFDEKTDLAVLKIDPSGHTLTAATFGDSDNIRVGDWVLAIGNPFGLGGTVTAGIISARARNINSGPYDDYLQTDASINRGNSGGPMFNLAGEVIGINTAIFSPTGGSVGIGFAIPSSQAKNIINQLIEFGQTRRGWLGVRIQSVTDEIAESLGLEEPRGALVASVTPKGPAEAAGIEAGDIILEFEGTPIQEMRELPRVVAETRINTEAEIIVLNKGKEKKLTVKIGELEKAEKEGLLGTIQTANIIYGTKIKPLGVTVATISPALSNEFAIAEDIKNGIIITEIDPSSEAAEKGIIAGDVITEINQKAIKKPEDLSAAIEEAQEQKRSSVLLLINRDGDVRFVAIKIADND